MRAHSLRHRFVSTTGRRACRIPALAAAFALALWGAAAAESAPQPGSLEKGDAAKGEIIARRWCAACHVVAPDQPGANADAPTFASVARRGDPPEKLKGFLTNPHPRMPDMNLSRGEIADIVAYIGGLNP